MVRFCSRRGQYERFENSRQDYFQRNGSLPIQNAQYLSIPHLQLILIQPYIGILRRTTMSSTGESTAPLKLFRGIVLLLFIQSYLLQLIRDEYLFPSRWDVYLCALRFISPVPGALSMLQIAGFHMGDPLTLSLPERSDPGLLYLVHSILTQSLDILSS